MAQPGKRRQWQLLPNSAQLAGNGFLLTNLETSVISRSVVRPGAGGGGYGSHLSQLGGLDWEFTDYTIFRVGKVPQGSQSKLMGKERVALNTSWFTPAIQG